MQQEEQLTAIATHPSLNWLNSFLETFSHAEIFFVGGCVRDIFLGRSTKDVDIIVRSVPAPDLEKWFSQHGTINLVGKTFGVYKFVPDGLKEEIDIAIPRTEYATEDSHGRYKDVKVDARTDLPIEMDLARRDFTINAMAFDVRYKHLVDPYHGKRDLESKTLRAIGIPKTRFEEDLSRLLRAVRFACTLGFHIESETWSAIQSLASRLIEKVDDQYVVPRETIGREFLKSFLADPLCTITRYETAGFLSVLFPAIDVATAKHNVEDVGGLSPKLLLALFLSATDLDNAQHILLEYHFSQFPRADRFHVSTQELLWLLRSVHLVDVVESPSLLPGSTFERLFLGSRGEDLLALLALIRPEAKEKMQRVRERREIIQKIWGDEIPELMSGQDLIRLGHTPGPSFRKMQQAVRDAQLDGSVRSKEDALALVQKMQ